MPNSKKPSHNRLRLLKYCQNDEISPNLLTLITSIACTLKRLCADLRLSESNILATEHDVLMV